VICLLHHGCIISTNRGTALCASGRADQKAVPVAPPSGPRPALPVRLKPRTYPGFLKSNISLKASFTTFPGNRLRSCIEDEGSWRQADFFLRTGMLCCGVNHMLDYQPGSDAFVRTRRLAKPINSPSVAVRSGAGQGGDQDVSMDAFKYSERNGDLWIR